MAEEIINYNIIGKIVSISQDPLSQAKITSPNGDSTLSETNGEFLLTGTYTLGEIFKITISLPNYSQRTINPFTLKKNLKNKGNLGPIVLKSVKEDLDKSIKKELTLPNDQLKKLQKSKMNFETAKQQTINDLMTRMKTVLIPSILTLIAEFGISNAEEMLGKNMDEMNPTCPASLEKLNQIIEKKNKLTKTLNNQFKFLNTIKIGSEINEKIISVSEIAVETISKLAIFFPVAGFGAPDPSKALTAPDGIIDKIKEILKKLGLTVPQLVLILGILVQTISKILKFLSLLDSLVGKCAQEKDSNGEVLSQEKLSEDLLKATEEQSNQGSPVITNVNGFEMGVVSVDNVIVGGLKRRQAIARNADGVIMLKGTPSFSSNDQILIDELVFYIQSNNLTTGAGTSSNNTSTSSTTSSPSLAGTGGSSGGGGGGGGY
jgi:hypothetical protein